MSLAEVVASWSKDPSTGVGAVIVDQNQRVVSVGFNGLPRLVYDHQHRLADRPTKLKVTLHAEENAILFAKRDLTGCTCYTWPMPPCSHCAALLIQAGVTRVVGSMPTLELMDRWKPDFLLAEEMYNESEVKFELYERPVKPGGNPGPSGEKRAYFPALSRLFSRLRGKQEDSTRLD